MPGESVMEENKAGGQEEELLPMPTPEEDARQIKETVRDMVTGILFFSFIFGAVGGIIAGEAWYRWVLGVILGTGTAGLMLWHMYVTIDRALDMDEESANKYMKKSAIKRLIMAVAAFAVGGLIPGVFHVLGVLAGVFSLKFSAYLQPLTHKIIKLLSKGG